MSDSPEGKPAADFQDCPATAALQSNDWKACLYGAPEAAALAARNTSIWISYPTTTPPGEPA